MSIRHRKTWIVATYGLALAWPIMATAGTHHSMQEVRHLLKQMQQQLQQQQHRINAQQHKIEKLESLVQAMAGQPKSKNQTSSGTQLVANEQPSEPRKQHKPKKSLRIGGILTMEYQILDSAHDNAAGGSTTQGVFAINAKGRYKNLTFALEQRVSQNSFADRTYLHYGWVAYHFGPQKHQQIKAGFFQVPFGNLPFGYQTFWGNLAYFAGFTDNQAAGIGYKYEAGGWRFDLDFFKDDDLSQHSLYGSNPFEGYNQINGGNARLAYTFNQGGTNSLQLSVAARGGQLAVGGNDANGSHWAATAALDAELGPWTLQGQFVNYQYNIPSGKSHDGMPCPATRLQSRTTASVTKFRPRANFTSSTLHELLISTSGHSTAFNSTTTTATCTRAMATTTARATVSATHS